MPKTYVVKFEVEAKTDMEAYLAVSRIFSTLSLPDSVRIVAIIKQ